MQKTAATADERPPVIVFTCGRTGSTLLLRMLNCLPGTIAWGEHGGLLKPLLQSYSKGSEAAVHPLVVKGAELLQPIIDRQAVIPGRRMSLEWFNWFTADDIDRLYRNSIRELFYPESVRDRFTRWGFKEIRYRDSEYATLRQLYPRMKAIILYRNPAAVCASQFKHFAKNKPDRLPSVIRNVDKFYQFAAKKAEDQPERDVLFISYEAIVASFARSSLLLEDFLEEKFAPQLRDIDNDVVTFLRRKNRSEAKLTEDPIAAFAAWTAQENLTAPAKEFERLVEHYDAIRASPRNAVPTGADRVAR